MKKESDMNAAHYLVDRQHPLPENYIPEDLIAAPIPFDCPPEDPKRLICRPAYEPLKKMYEASLKAGLKLYGVSAFRSFKRQQEIYLASIIKNGVKHTEQYIAPPGMSEHQTGLAIDFSCPELNFELTEAFENTPEGIWLRENAVYFGFTFSYPKGCESETGYAYEPWHLCFACKSAKYFVYY